MYAGTDGRLESIIPKLDFAPLYVNTRWWRRALRARRWHDTQPNIYTLPNQPKPPPPL